MPWCTLSHQLPFEIWKTSVALSVYCSVFKFEVGYSSLVPGIPALRIVMYICNFQYSFFLGPCTACFLFPFIQVTQSKSKCQNGEDGTFGALWCIALGPCHVSWWCIWIWRFLQYYSALGSQVGGCQLLFRVVYLCQRSRTTNICKRNNSIVDKDVVFCFRIVICSKHKLVLAGMRSPILALLWECKIWWVATSKFLCTLRFKSACQAQV